MTISEGEVLEGRYDLIEVIGRGGMADVYRARDRRLGRTVAIKLLRDVGATETDRARFRDEALTLARLTHPGLVTLLDVGTSTEQEFLVMELVEGETLAQTMSRGRMPATVVAQIGHQLATAIAYAHAADVIHRDVKPGNVLIRRDGQALLADFGIARLVGQTRQHTRTGITIGSPAYFSPEQVSGRDITTATDIYSLGLVLLEALTGRREYDGPSTEAALARLARPPAIPADLSPEWRTMLTAMTASEPADRPTAEQVAATIPAADPFAIGHPVPTQAPPPTRVLSQQEVEPPEIQQVARAWGGFAEQPRTWAPHLSLQASTVVVLVMIGLGVLLLAVAMATDDGTAPSPPAVPEGVGPEYKDLLEELHDVLYGSPE